MPAIRSVLIANRGEIAVRVIRTCRALGVETVLAASDADLQSVPARLAERVIRLGPAQAGQSYLNVEAVIDAARTAGVDAIHPGYGFLSENAALARAAADAGLIFIGPTEDQLKAVGDKLRARKMAAAAGLPVVPGGPAANLEQARKMAGKIGWPVMIKAVGGGGGRGMKRVYGASELPQAMELAIAEADAAFADARVYLERFVESGRHVEVQILGDGRNVIHLGDRDCSVQRRYQKLVEEAPAPHLDEETRTAMREAAVALGSYIQYRGLGTVEFLLDAQRGAFYFLEMNARIQVEHTVTEAITGIDLIAEQIMVAEGRPLRLCQSDIRLQGHALECRINAEDCAHEFRPSPGRINRAMFPAGPGIRVDTHIEEGVDVPPYYDSLLAKVIVHGKDRAVAVRNMRSALANCRLDGVETNIAMHAALMADPEFSHGGVDTGFFARFRELTDNG